MSTGSAAPVRIVGRYALYGELAAGGMATVHLGRLLGAVGFSRTVAIKRLHEQFAKDPEFVSMFLDEARLCARIRHPNVVPTLDVIASDRQLLLVMEYVPGESLSRLHRAAIARGERMPVKVAVAVLSGVLHGLHAAHEAKDEHGRPLGIVHRDVSPQNVLVGADGVARVLDFGIAKAKGRLHTTQDGKVKGKLSYMAPEQLRSETVDRRSDVFAASVMAWELCTGKRLFEGESEGATITKVLMGEIPRPSVAAGSDQTSPEGKARAAEIAPLDEIILRGLSRDPGSRFETARGMADAMEEAVHTATAGQVGGWVESVAAEALAMRNTRVQEIESFSADVTSHVSEVITQLTSDPDVTKTQEVSASQRIAVPPVPSSQDLLSKAHEPVSKSGLAAPPPRGFPRALAWGVAITALVLLGILVNRGRPVATLPPSPPAVAASPASVPTEVPTVAPAATPSEPAASAAPPSPSAASPSTSASAHPAGAPPRPARPPAKPSSTVDCRDPYTRDALGRKIYKLECL